MTSYCPIRNWKDCPYDILFMILKKLSLLDIHQCFQVNKSWREAVTNYCDHYDVWKHLLEFTMFNGGNTVKEHTYNDGRDKEVYINSILWKNIHLAKCEISYKAQYAKHIHVDNDRLIIVFNNNVVVYNIENFNQIEEIRQWNYEDFQYKGPLTCIIFDFGPYSILLKSNCSCKTAEIFKSIPEPTFWSMNKEACYFLDTNYSIWKYVVGDCDNHLHFITNYYGDKSAVQRFYVENDSVYVVQKSGQIVMYSELESNKIFKTVHRIWGLKNVDCVLFWYDSEVSIYGCSEPKTIQFVDNDTNMSLICYNLSAAIRHGNLLLLGYNNGLLEVYETVPRIIFKIIPVARFKLEKYTQMPIREIVVHEGNRTHTIFVLAGIYLAKIYLTHAYS